MSVDRTSWSPFPPQFPRPGSSAPSAPAAPLSSRPSGSQEDVAYETELSNGCELVLALCSVRYVALLAYVREEQEDRLLLGIWKDE